MSKLAKKLLDVGIHYDVPAADYHADCAVQTSLSRSVAWTMAQRAPIHAWLEHPRLNPDAEPDKPNARMKFGSIGHELLLGQESTCVLGKWDDFMTKDARLWRDECLAAGKIPVLPAMMEKALLLKECALGHIKNAGFADEFARGRSEVTVIGKYKDETYIRARFDKLLIDPAGAKDRQHSETVISFDVKITADASPEACRKQMGNMGYDLQEKFYTEALSAADKIYVGRQRMIFLFVENEFPFCVTPVELDNKFKAVASARFDRAMSRWKECLAKDDWPTFCSGIGTFMLSPPRYIEMQELEDEPIDS